MGALVTNNAVGTLASSINNSTTTVVLSSGQGALFPSPGAGQYFYITVVDNANNKEIMKVTARSVNTLTVVRAQDNTAAQAFTGGDRVELRFVAALHNNYAQKDSANTFVGDQTITGDQDVSGDSTADTYAADTQITTPVQEIVAAAGVSRPINWRSGNDLRWRLRADAVAEDGSNAGSDMRLEAYANDGSTLLGLAMLVARATGIMTVLNGFKIGSDKADHFPSGTKLLFPQSAAPTGWVQDTDVNDRVIRVVNTAGGGTGGSWTLTGVTVDNHTLSVAELPAHSHVVQAFRATHGSNGSSVGDNNFCSSNGDQVSGAQPTLTSTNTGSGLGHNHGLTSDGTWRPSRLDVVKATKT